MVYTLLVTQKLECLLVLSLGWTYGLRLLRRHKCELAVVTNCRNGTKRSETNAGVKVQAVKVVIVKSRQGMVSTANRHIKDIQKSE